MPTARKRVVWLPRPVPLAYVGGNAEYEIHVLYVVDELHQFRPAEMRMPADQDMRVGEMAANAHKHAAHNHSVLSAGGAFVGVQRGGHVRAGEAVRDQPVRTYSKA